MLSLVHILTYRYGQELLTRGQAETEGFKIDTTGKFGKSGYEKV